MRRVLTALILSLLAVTFIACGVKVNQPPPGAPGPG
jgi:hypothetical protein